MITNPSARYKPDGTGGIINIVLKKKRAKGVSGTVRVTAGNNRRYGLSVGGNYNPGPYNLFGSYAIRQDDRRRLASEQRSYIDPTTNLPATVQTRTTDDTRPFSQLGEAGTDYGPGPEDKLREVVDFSYRTMDRVAIEHDVSANNLGAVTSDFQRVRLDPEVEADVQSQSSYEHDFGSPDDALTVDFRAEHHTETENNHYTNIYAVPAGPPTPEFIRISTNEPGTETEAEYVDELDKNSKLDLGFDLSAESSHEDNLDLLPDPSTGLLVSNPQVTNSFILAQTITALYGTYAYTWGRFAAQAGLRGETAEVESQAAHRADQPRPGIRPALSQPAPDRQSHRHAAAAAQLQPPGAPAGHRRLQSLPPLPGSVQPECGQSRPEAGGGAFDRGRLPVQDRRHDLPGNAVLPLYL